MCHQIIALWCQRLWAGICSCNSYPPMTASLVGVNSRREGGIEGGTEQALGRRKPYLFLPQGIPEIFCLFAECGRTCMPEDLLRPKSGTNNIRYFNTNKLHRLRWHLSTVVAIYLQIYMAGKTSGTNGETKQGSAKLQTYPVRESYCCIQDAW